MLKKHSEGRVFNKNVALKTILITAFFIFVIYTIINAETIKAEIIDGNMVYVDTSKVYFSASPHTITTNNDNIEFKLISKQFSGDIDIAFGFDSDMIKPRNVKIHKNDEWIDISNIFDPYNYDYGGMDKWYLAESVNINSGELYTLKGNFNIIGSGEGKYWICAKPSSQTLNDAVSSGNFLCLDPWWNVSYLFKYTINTSCAPCSSNINGLWSLNDTDGISFVDGTQYIWSEYIAKPTRTDDVSLYFTNSTFYQVVNETDPDNPFAITMSVDQGNVSDFGNTENDLLLWLHLNGTDGYDSSIYKRSSTLCNTPVVGNGQIGNAAQFRDQGGEIDECISYGDVEALDNISDLTVCAWFNGIEQGGIVSKFDGSTTSGWWLAHDVAADRLYFGLHDGSWEQNSIIDATLLTSNIWIFGCGTYDGENARIYINGKLRNTDTNPSGNITGNNDDLRIATPDSSTPGYWDYKGRIDEVRIYNRTLSDEEIQAIYNNTVGNQNFAIIGELLSFANTSLLGVNFDIPDFTLSSLSFVDGILVQFNTTKPDTVFSLLSSMNMEKISAGGINTISSKVFVDGILLIEEDLRTVTGLNNIGAVGLSPLRFNVSSGEHNITVQFARTGSGSILIDNIDFVLLEMVSNQNENVRSELIDVDYNHSSQTFEDAFNFTVNKILESRTFLTVKQTVTKVTSGISNLTYRFFNFNTSISSPEWLRTLDGTTDIGSVSGVYVMIDNQESFNATIQSKQSDVGDTVFVNGTLLNLDMIDDGGTEFNSFQVTNENTNSTNPLTLGPGYHLLLNVTSSIDDGDSFFISMTSSFSSESGLQTPMYLINSSIGNCSQKDRTLSNNLDIGNAFIYVICENLTSDQDVDFMLWVNVPIGESLKQIDESFNGFETTSFSIVFGNLPPIPGEITNPDDGDNVTGTDTITWLAFIDPNEGIVTYNISLLNINGTLNLTIIDSITDNFANVNWDTFINNTYILQVEGCDPTDLCSTSNITINILPAPIPPIPDLDPSITFCESNTTLRITENERIIENDVINDTESIIRIRCIYGCSNWTWTTLGNPGCNESDFTFTVMMLMGFIILVGLIRLAIK